MQSLAALIVIGALSLGLLTFVDDNVSAFLLANAPQLTWVGRYRIASLVVCLALYLLSGPGRSFLLPRADANWRAVGFIAAVWFVPTLVLVYLVRIRLPHVYGTAGFVAFTVGLLGEELLFRGAVYQLAERGAAAADGQGGLWGALRPLTGSIWPAIAFHLATNLIADVRLMSGDN